MPKKGCYDNTYPDKLKEIKISLLEPFHGSKKHHDMRCDICDNEFHATPISKLQNFKKHGMYGCPECTNKQQYESFRKANLQKLNDRNITVLTHGYDGRRYLDYDKDPHLKILVRNENCGHTFECSPSNLLGREVECPNCNTQRKREFFQEINRENQLIYQETASEWNIFRHLVYQLTRITYTENKHLINPNNFTRALAGVEDGYQLDHIVPVRYCFDNNIPVEICTHYTNLQMLTWEDNLGSKANLKIGQQIPQILQEYIN